MGKIVGKTITKIITIMIIFQMVFMPISNAGFWDEIISSSDNFLSDGKNADASSSNVSQDKLDNIIDKIYNLLLALGIVVAVLVGAALGIKYMTGSIEQQAKIKETLIPYVLGCIVVFGAFGIWRILIVVLSKV